MATISGEHLRRQRRRSLITPGLRLPLLLLVGLGRCMGSMYAADHLLHGTAQTVARGVGPAGAFCVTMGLAVAFRRYFLAYFTV
ncbi:hypothetical protein F7Q99_28035 [Streptomyces kaniharaensis]|uniref:Uncharacterized protein n=1 Tax=Streptomyces kaniharaensis TaxID=212423 RepID=A0A6N7L1D8_9ACTN|nr:hypothetical protein [Streptomyces kaniharaensis]MQS15994.1 hypothetical protein [Streptomyces kaniharaensis]